MIGCAAEDDLRLSETEQDLAVMGEHGLVTGAMCGGGLTYMPFSEAGGIMSDRGYGCFCGPGNSKGMDARPLDPMDQCCKDHDLRWTEIEERYRSQGKSCDCRAVTYDVTIVSSFDGSPVTIDSNGIPWTTTSPSYPVQNGCNLTCSPVPSQPGNNVTEKECALECCEDARVMSTCMFLVPKDVPGAGAIGQGTPGGFEIYNPVFPQPNWGPWNPRYGTDPFHPRGPDPAGNLNRCLGANECGDGKCDYVEASRCSCPADCGFGQGMPVPVPVVVAKTITTVSNHVEVLAGIDDIDFAGENAVAKEAPAEEPRIQPGVPFPGMDPKTNLPVGGIGSAKPYCPANPGADGICVRIVSEGRADGPKDPDCPDDVPVCVIRSEDLHETPDHAWVRPDGSPPRGCGTTGQVFEIGYKCGDPAGFAAAKAWIAAWCGTPPDSIKDPGVRGVCNIDPSSIYRDNTWDVIFNIATSATDRCVNKCNDAWNQSTILDCQGDPISRCEWWNACRAACVAGLGPATMPPDNCGTRPVAVVGDGGLAMACSTGTAQANAASVSTYGVGLVTCYDYDPRTFYTQWGASGAWQTECTNKANLNYPPGPNRDEQIRCCMDRMSERCRTE
jgi:hypothetical protein